ncbi:GntR family transcriptional regulator [Pandoraea nosoerga]|uniref:GntR family transcriptional regulator n=2 Tax=Pandoraea nosoerga TaxID=2508296 RepID=A0A5E4Y3A0_9BURK|nr:GntR family transcriptional regulator [Pandoraea nosoerga]VVE43169.1 GntR family transcriptional regulator [Pandoraea nosoerga]
MEYTSQMKAPSNLITGDVRTKIRSMILDSEFRPGQRLIEDELIRLLNVGRTPVREALLILQGEGFIARHRGWEVQGVDHLEVQAIFESRAAIEAETARLAARKITPQACDALAALIEQMTPESHRPRRVLNRLNTEFHERVAKAADNVVLAQFHERTQFHYWALRVPVMFSDEQLVATNHEHRELLAALRAHDEDAAERLARAHVETTRAIVEPALAR